MNITSLSFFNAEAFVLSTCVSFIKPHRSALHRVFMLPDLEPDKEKEATEVLNTVCLRKHKGIWYFDMRDPETEKELFDIFLAMDIQPIAVKLDADPAISN